MGLDILEFVLEVEEIFGIKIPDNLGGQIKNLGEFSELVSGLLEVKREGEQECLSAKGFEQARRGLASFAGVDPQAIGRETEVKRVLAGGGLKRKWRALRKEIPELGKLELPMWGKRLMRAGMWGWGLMTGGYVIFSCAGILSYPMEEIRQCGQSKQVN